VSAFPKGKEPLLSEAPAELRRGGSSTSESPGIKSPAGDQSVYGERRSFKKWYKCKRCGQWVLSWKRARGIHNKKCPPENDPNVVFDSFFTKSSEPKL
jgi:hypothetical protein